MQVEWTNPNQISELELLVELQALQRWVIVYIKILIHAALTKVLDGVKLAVLFEKVR